jgi:uncharacterized membrane protein YfcA
LLLVPAMVIVFAMPQKSAQGVSLAVMVPMALLGAVRYVMNPAIKVDLRIAAMIAVGAVVGALIGAQLAGWLPARVLKRCFAVFLLVVAGRMFWATVKAPPKQGTTPTASSQQTPTAAERGEQP